MKITLTEDQFNDVQNTDLQDAVRMLTQFYAGDHNSNDREYAIDLLRGLSLSNSEKAAITLKILSVKDEFFKNFNFSAVRIVNKHNIEFLPTNEQFERDFKLRAAYTEQFNQLYYTLFKSKR